MMSNRGNESFEVYIFNLDLLNIRTNVEEVLWL